MTVPTGDERPVSPVLRALDWLQGAQLKLATAALVVMMLVTTADVILRYTLNRPIRGSYDIVESMLLVFVFHGIAAGFFARKNIVIDFVDLAAPPAVRAAMIKLSDVLTVAALVLLGSAMIRPALQAFEYGDTKIDLGLPVYVLWIAAGLGMAGTIVCAVLVMLLKPATMQERPHP